MPQITDNRRLTCRYWALGPACPNVSRNGYVFCSFPHCDTGQLSSPNVQRGTCLNWSKTGVCYRVNCPYEHRYTGVTGLGQGGAIELYGVEAGIANAAYRSGFNTKNHEALFDLIWAVKKVALKSNLHPRFNRPKPPPHPIYPDRYRPSGVGDNTRSKRKLPDYNPDEPLKFHPVKPLTKAGTRTNPISVDDNDDDTQKTKAANSSAKRRKVDDSRSVAGGVPESEIVQEMLEVKSRFWASRRDMNKCQLDMKILFDKHHSTFDDDEMMRILNDLSEHLNRVFDRAKDGMESVDRALAWLKGAEVEVKIE